MRTRALAETETLAWAQTLVKTRHIITPTRASIPLPCQRKGRCSARAHEPWLSNATLEESHTTFTALLGPPRHQYKRRRTRKRCESTVSQPETSSDRPQPFPRRATRPSPSPWNRDHLSSLDQQQHQQQPGCFTSGRARHPPIHISISVIPPSLLPSPITASFLLSLYVFYTTFPCPAAAAPAFPIQHSASVCAPPSCDARRVVHLAAAMPLPSPSPHHHHPQLSPLD